ncbi:hypothetical protein FQA39_LY12218 [Lamprigera yunnana]|nr:hypothetical protein FQA39_LY12218 [Lamprigera yunnana]
MLGTVQEFPEPVAFRIEVRLHYIFVLSKGKLTSNDILVMPMNMLDYASHQQSFDIALAHFGQIDVLFNNAGRSQRATWEDIHYLVDKELFDLNVFSVINLTRVAIHYFNSRGNGHVAVTSSGAGLFGAPYSASYTGSKHAIHGYYNSLRLEKQDSKVKLAVTIICPGPTSTEFLQECFTNNHGEKYGIDVKETDRRMSGERCGQLCAIALANKSTEAWMSIFPVLHILYAYVYYPTLVNFIFRIFGTKRFFRFRDSTDPTFFKEVHNI